MKKHGHTGDNGKILSTTYRSWKSMKQRCNDNKDSSFSSYGGRGITVCGRWNSFENFLIDMGERPENTTLDRINNNGNYNKENCRWATPLQQSTNRKNNINLTYKNETKTLSEWCKEYNVLYNIAHYRLLNGMKFEDIFINNEKRDINNEEIPNERNEGICFLWDEDYSMQEIGYYYGISRQRVYQILSTFDK